MTGEPPGRTKTGKLVRDRIPAIIRARGGTPLTRTAGPREYETLLRAKLAAVAAEAATANREEFAGELTDVLDVVAAITDDASLSPQDLQAVRAAKAASRGGFGARIVWMGQSQRGGVEQAARFVHARVPGRSGGGTMTDDAVVCGKPFCDADLHDNPPALQAIIWETGSACPHCHSSGFGFAAEYRIDERPVHFLVVWHTETCPSLISGGYIIANLPETSLKTGDAIFSALARITDEDIRASAAGASWAEWQQRLCGERWPAHMIETARKITEREARQAARRAGTKTASSQAPLANAIGEISARHTEERS